MPAAAVSERRNEQEKIGAQWVGNVDRAGRMRLVGCGVDTWRVTWWVDPGSEAMQWFEKHPRSYPGVPNKGGGWVMSDKVADHTVGITSQGLIWAEGHPAPAGLAGASELMPAYTGLRRELGAADFPIPDGVSIRKVEHRPAGQPSQWPAFRQPGAAGVSRLDVTADFETPNQLYGHEYMASLSRSAFARGKARAYGSLGFWETIVIASPNGKKVLARFYDKGVESGDAPRGRLLRAEDQRRFSPERRRDVSEITATYLSQLCARRWRPVTELGRDQGGATVGDIGRLVALVEARYQQGDITNAKADRLIATLVRDYYNGNERRAQRTTLWRRRRELREMGLLAEDGEVETQLEIPLHEPFDLLKDSTVWA